MIKFSVLMPVYNTSRYLEESVDSVLNQSYSNFELIIVNDGSTDNSFDIIKKYQESDDRIKIVNQENKGLLAARRAPIIEITGDYVMFLDSDDFLALNCMEKINEKLSKSDIDLLIFDYIRVNLNSEVIEKKNKKSFIENMIISKNDFLKEFIQTNMYNNIWNKVVKTSILKSDKTDYTIFGRLMQSEDRLQSFPLIYRSNSIVKIDNKLHYYRTNPDSLTFNFSTNSMNDIIVVQKHLHDELTRIMNEVNLLQESVNYGIKYLTGGLLRCLSNKKISKQDKKMFLLEVKKIFLVYDKNLINKNNYRYYNLIIKNKYLSLKLISIINNWRLIKQARQS